MLSQIFLPLFFIYYFIIASSFKDLANCSLQRFISESLILKHITIIISIYVFTFVLFWYSFSSFSSLKSKLIKESKLCNSENIECFNQIQLERQANHKYFKKTFFLTLIIYITFILSTKNSGIFILIFIILVLVIMIILLYLYFNYGDIFKIYEKYLIINKQVKNKILKSSNLTESEINQYVLLNNLITILIIIMYICLIIGTYKYYLKQVKDHSNNWSLITFWFGKNTQCQSK